MKGSTFSRIAVGTMASAIIAMGLAPAQAKIELTPKLADLSGIVKDGDGLAWAIALGKALFWDQQVGSDGMACASCHFSAGADSRITNQFSPGFNNIPQDLTYGATEADLGFGYALGETKSGGIPGPNYTADHDDFPFHFLADEDPDHPSFEPEAELRDVDAPILSTTNDRLSSAGSFDAPFVKVTRSGMKDKCGAPNLNPFGMGGKGTRMVEPRHTPTMINAVFTHRQFWDGRANNVFNGVNVFGRRDVANDPNARIVVRENGEKPKLSFLDLKDASLSSQAVGPLTSNMEMSCDGRTIPDIGRKLLSKKRRPLMFQKVHPEDSVFGNGNGPGGITLRRGHGKGLKFNYAKMIRKAFEKKYWSARGRYKIEAGVLKKTKRGYTQMELNFSMFQGIAVMAYEATLVSDESPFDFCDPERVGGSFECSDQPTMTEDELEGFAIFRGFGRNGGRCIICHAPPLFTNAGFQDGQTFNVVQRVNMPRGNDQRALRDRGFLNVGLRPTLEDVHNGGLDPYGQPLSFARQFLDAIDGVPAPDGDVINVTGPCDPALGGGVFECTGGVPTPPIVTSAERVAVDGALKTSSLRNIGLTPPYFHYGGYSTLEEVMHSYVRRGSVRLDTVSDAPDDDNSGSGPLGQSTLPLAAADDKGSNLDNGLRTLPNCDADCQHKMILFMLTLSDPNVQCDAKQFDHPELKIFVGHKDRDRNHDGRADDLVYVLPAVGESGYSAESGYCIPNEGDLFAVGMRAQEPSVESGRGRGHDDDHEDDREDDHEDD